MISKSQKEKCSAKMVTSS
uniref:Uncharacterized protein n=1 Tax=Arundo donax TaxID=35708 RepID=A0A0A8Z2B3_ARUDO